MCSEQFKITPNLNRNHLHGLNDTLDSFNKLGISIDNQTDILKSLIAILHLGNIEFEQSILKENGCKVRDTDCIEKSCHLLGIDCEQFCRTLTVRTLSVPSKDKVSVLTVPCEDPSECQARLHACMQLLYKLLFSHVVGAVNKAVQPTANPHSFVGILDVYGFEEFQVNSLEQLCINYANERLQQAFARNFLQTELKILSDEGCDISEYSYPDNSACLTALHSRLSVFGLLNEECQLHKGGPVDEVR